MFKYDPPASADDLAGRPTRAAFLNASPAFISENDIDQHLRRHCRYGIEYNVPKVSRTRRNESLVPLIEAGHSGRRQERDRRPTESPEASRDHWQCCPPRTEKQITQHGIAQHMACLSEVMVPEGKRAGIDRAE